MPTGEDQPVATQPSAENGDPPETPHDPKNSGSWATPQIGRRATLPSKRACGIAGIVAGLLDLAILLNDGRPVLRSLFGAVFLGVFVYVGMRLMTAARRKIRPDPSDLVDLQTPAHTSGQTPSQLGSPNKPAGAPKGGWANPTVAQKFARRITRMASNYGKRRPPRR